MSELTGENIRHLELIQGVINRMAQISFLIKGWTVPMVAALWVIAAYATDWWYGFLALAPTFILWGLDAYYLRQERLFRCLYNMVRTGSTEPMIPTFSMNTEPCRETTKSWLKTLKAPTIIFLHGAVVALVTLLTIVIGLVT